MFNTSTAFNEAIMANTRELAIKLTLMTADETWELGPSDIELGSLSITSSCMSKEFELGAVTASTCDVSLNNRDGRWDSVRLDGATLIPYCGVKLPDETIEYVPMGMFIVDQPGRPYAALQLKATDRLILLDEPLPSHSYPTTNSSLLLAIGTHCNVPIAASALSALNMGHVIRQAPTNNAMTCRDALAEIALMAGGWARMSRSGELEIVQLVQPDLETAFNMRLGSRMTWKQTEDPINITGMAYEGVQWGDTEYLIEIDTLELLDIADATSVLGAVWNEIDGFYYVPFTATYYGNPAFDPGDSVLHSLRDGKEILSLITKHVYKFGGSCTMTAEGKSAAALNYKSANVRRLASVAAKINHDTDVKLSSYEQASANMSDMIGLMLGVYPSKDELEDGSAIYYWHDKPTLNESQIIWRFNGLTLASSDDGGLTWHGQTASGTILARFIDVITLRAEQITSGSIDTSLIKIGDKTLEDTLYEIGQEINQLVSGGGNLLLNSNFGTGAEPSDTFWSDRLEYRGIRRRELKYGAIRSGAVDYALIRAGDV